MKKILAIVVALLLAAAPALAQRDETIYATLSPTGEVLSVEAGVRVEGEAGEYTETGRLCLCGGAFWPGELRGRRGHLPR